MEEPMEKKERRDILSIYFEDEKVFYFPLDIHKKTSGMYWTHVTDKTSLIEI
jgi:hypothetical protein